MKTPAKEEPLHPSRGSFLGRRGPRVAPAPGLTVVYENDGDGKIIKKDSYWKIRGP
jgi:hypothetical protein